MSKKRESRGRLRVVVFSAASVAVTLVALVVGALATTVLELEKLGPALSSELDAAERRVAKLSRDVHRVRERAELTAWMQEQMRGRNPRLSASAAAHYTELLLEVTDRYEAVDPLFLLAVGIVESRFETHAKSHANARGLYQIWPPTGRWLAAELGWEYTDAMLHVPEKNTELAASYLEKLFATYGDPKLVLAEYNGGPRNARRFRRGSADLAVETREYVVKVMGTFERLAADSPAVAMLEATPAELEALSDD